MFLTIAIPVYNKELYIERLLKSVIMQNSDDYEILIVDDGSTDNSLNICRRWQKKMPDLIRIIEKENEGSLLTRRVCINEARGDYIYFVDADDYLIDSNFISEAKEIILEKKCDLLFFNISSKSTLVPCCHYGFRDQTIFKDEQLVNIYKLAIAGDSLNSLCNKIFHRNLVDWKEDYLLYPRLTNGTDMFQCMPILFKAKKIVYWDKVAYYYQIDNNTSSIVHSYNATTYDSLKINYLRLKELCDKKQLISSEYETALKNRFMMFVSTAAFKIRFSQN